MWSLEASICFGGKILGALWPSDAEAQHLPLNFAQGLLRVDWGKRVMTEGKMAAWETWLHFREEQSLGKAHGKWLKRGRISWSLMLFVWETLGAAGVLLFVGISEGICQCGGHGSRYWGLTCHGHGAIIGWSSKAQMSIARYR